MKRIFFLLLLSLLPLSLSAQDAATERPTPTPRPAAEEPKAEPPLRDLTLPAQPEVEQNNAGASPGLPAPEAPQVNPAPTVPQKPEPPARPARSRHGSRGHGIVSIMSDSTLEAGDTADAVVAVMGDSTARGPVHGAVVAVLGDAEASENVGEAVVAVLGSARADKEVGRDVVAVLGDATVNGTVHGNVVAVFGTVRLGPGAKVYGNAVSVGDEIERAAGAQIFGELSEVPFFRNVPVLATAGMWFRETLLKGRLLSFNPSIIWPWVLAISFLGFYVLLSLAANRAVVRCAETLEQRPGRTILTTFLCIVAFPPLLVLMTITAVGLPVLLLGLFVGLLMGKAAFLVFLGRRIALPLGMHHAAVAALIGGAILLLIYTIPVLGLLVWVSSGVIGIGMIVYTIALSSKRPPSAPLPPGTAIPPTTPAGTATIVQTQTPAATAGSNDAASMAAASSAATAAATASVLPPPLVLPGAATTPVTVASALPRAGFWIRTLAALLDVVLIAILGSMIGIPELFPFTLSVYCAVMWGLKGTTIGGIICGLKVVRLDDRKLDWTVALVRVLAAFLSFAVICLGFIWVAFDDERQSWHDKIAGTTIVRMPKGVSLV
jgi:uncharacterized RDD family membrane protein YckC